VPFFRQRQKYFGKQLKLIHKYGEFSGMGFKKFSLYSDNIPNIQVLKKLVRLPEDIEPGINLDFSGIICDVGKAGFSVFPFCNQPSGNAYHLIFLKRIKYFLDS
jgi:hypothetical protein